MKTHYKAIALMLSGLGLLIASSLQAAPESESAAMYPVSCVRQQGSKVVEIGTADSTVRYFLGQPDRRPLPHIWIYTGFRADTDRANADECTVLVLQFIDRRVSAIRLTNPRAKELIVARCKADPEAVDHMMVATQ